MIADSVPWREELRKSAVRLKRWSAQKRWTSRTYYLAERDIMMGAYSIRRLIESQKSSTRLPRQRVRTQRYPLRGRRLMHLDHFEPEQFYDMTSPTQAELEIGKLCNQIIHSFVFQIYLDEESRTTSVVFISDKDRDKHLHGVAFEDLAELFDLVGREDIVSHSGTMIDGQQVIENVSNHDAVADGRAVYLNDDRIFIDWVHEEIPAFCEEVLAMVRERTAEQDALRDRPSAEEALDR